ncbi:MAG: hypothetical protein II220_00315, partial [Spirochaetales bacterium]|nr:hypothetical protein [Spirochaetales bacterium]
AQIERYRQIDEQEALLRAQQEEQISAERERMPADVAVKSEASFQSFAFQNVTIEEKDIHRQQEPAPDPSFVTHHAEKGPSQELSQNENLKLSLDFEDSVNTEASAIEEISATLVESSASIMNISNSTHSSAEKLSTSAEKAKASFTLIDRITTSITNISEQSKKIQNALSLIYDVTNETEMLAMNASIEAAKAGEFGKGFSVVANEIRELAEKSQDSVSDIDEKIKQNNEIVENTQNVIADSQKTLKEILDMTIVSDQFLSQIAVAINETSTGQDELLKAVDNINAAMTKIVGLMENMKTKAKKIDEISSIMESILKQSK